MPKLRIVSVHENKGHRRNDLEICSNFAIAVQNMTKYENLGQFSASKDLKLDRADEILRQFSQHLVMKYLASSLNH